jgi:hypothetical protein
MNKKTNPQALQIAFFTILGLLALQIPLTAMLGANTNFTAYDLFAPALGGILGAIPAILTIVLTQMLNIMVHGAATPNIAGIIRIFPTLFATLYFARNQRLNIFVPFLAIIAFNLHPIGHSAWQYSLFWLIPIVANYFRKNLFVKSLGATFAAHAVGGALWIWTFGLSKEMWLALIPQTMVERTIFAVGVSATYLTGIYLSNIIGSFNPSTIFRTLKPYHHS